MPVRQVMDAVDAIRGGDFDARTEVSRRDEIGQLAHAVDDMAEGLAHRERIKETFRQYVDPAVAERLMDGDAHMDEGVAMRATVLWHSRLMLSMAVMMGSTTVGRRPRRLRTPATSAPVLLGTRVLVMRTRIGGK